MIMLRRCPFCGGEAQVHTGVSSGVPHYSIAYVFCSKCIVSTREFEDTEHDGEYVFKAKESWNRRIEDDDDDN